MATGTLEGKEVRVRWTDSYGALAGWQNLEETADPETLTVTSWGKVVRETGSVIAIAGSYAAATERTPEQANGIMVIPKACVTCVTCLCETKASCPERFFHSFPCLKN